MESEISSEAKRILALASERGIILRLLGGLAVWFVSPTASKPEYKREYNDIDLIGFRKQSKAIEKLFSELGYVTKGMFNKLQGDSRLKFFDEKSGRRIDIFLEKFVMCHEFDFRDDLAACEKTLSPADLLLTKLQVVEINRKDIMDTLALLTDHPLVADASKRCSGIETARILSSTSKDWGICKTITLNLDKVMTMLETLEIPAQDKQVASERISKLRNAIEDAPKTFGWKMRAKVGEKVKWYELPEQV